MKQPTICTIIAENYRGQARCLAQSFLQHNPDGRVYVLIVDYNKKIQDERFTTVPINQVHIPDLEKMRQRYTMRELCTAVKPFFLQHLFETQRLEKILYFDPDIFFYAPLDEVWQILDYHPAIVTPHLLGELATDSPFNEFSILAAGAYNLGFLGLRDDPAVRRLLHWWGERLTYYAHCRTEKHQHFDQRWMDLIHNFLPDVYIDRHPGHNVAYWDLPNRTITHQDNQYTVNSQPLVYFHFSGYSPERPHILCGYQSHITFSKYPALRPLFDTYRKHLIANGFTNSERIDPTADKQVSLYQAGVALATQFGIKDYLFNLIGPRTVSSLRRCLIKLQDYTKPTEPLPFGLNIVGYFGRETGVGEVARRMADALALQNLPYATVSVDEPNENTERGKTQYNTTLLHVNADALEHIPPRIEQLLRRSQHAIGYWWWELERFPEKWSGRFERFNELWVGSSFIKRALEAHIPIPITVIGVPIKPGPTASMSRKELGLPEDTHLVLTVFNAASYIGRKNPYGAIEAFTRAFGTSHPRVRLVVKTMNLKRHKGHNKRLRQMLAAINGILIDETWPRNKMNALIRACDSYISLHRAEGFGLLLAEAMYFGKPVIATNYGGNTDFMNTQNSFPVGYYLTPIIEQIGPYLAGELWAEPDLNEAAAHMQTIITNPSQAASVAALGATTIRKQYAPTRVGERIVQRLTTAQPKFTTNWFSGSRPQHFAAALQGMHGKLRFLEIGCWEGQTTYWLAEMFHQATIEVIDTFQGSPEHIDQGIYDLPNLRQRFEENTNLFSNRLTVHVGKSEDILPTLRKSQYDFIYVDGSHAAIDVHTDAIWSWRLLKKGGILAFDDYIWRQDLSEQDRPQKAIDHFLNNRQWEYKLLHKSSFVIVKKL